MCALAQLGILIFIHRFYAYQVFGAIVRDFVSINIDSKLFYSTLDIVSLVLFSFSILIWIFFFLYELIHNRCFYQCINPNVSSHSRTTKLAMLLSPLMGDKSKSSSTSRRVNDKS